MRVLSRILKKFSFLANQSNSEDALSITWHFFPFHFALMLQKNILEQYFTKLLTHYTLHKHTQANTRRIQIIVQTTNYCSNNCNTVIQINTNFDINDDTS